MANITIEASERISLSDLHATPQQPRSSKRSLLDPPSAEKYPDESRRRVPKHAYTKVSAWSRFGVLLKVNGRELGTVCADGTLLTSHADIADSNSRHGTPSEEQQAIIDLIVRQRKSCFITGGAGTGKSFLLKHIERELLKVRPCNSVHVTASTSIAAVNVGGRTIHSFAGIGFGEGPSEILIKRALTYAGHRWYDASCLIIDEVSTLSGEFLDMLDQIARAARRKPESPFGGLQIVLCGDFCQLGPVKPQSAREYAFEAAVWDEAVQHHLCLKRAFRQDNDNFFAGFLEELRLGHVSSRTSDALSRCQRQLSIANGVLPTKLHCTNRDADADNARELAKLKGSSHVYSALDNGPTNLFESFPKNGSAQKEVELKIGAQVVLTKNLDAKLVNGSRGVVQAFSEGGLPIVSFDNGLQKEVAPVRWRVGADDKYFREQVPLRLAWAITIHRCQGLTLDKAEVSLADAFAPGQAYVALSRIRSLEGLQVHSFDPSKVKVSPKVAAFYSSARFSTSEAPVEATEHPTQQAGCEPRLHELGSQSKKRKSSPVQVSLVKRERKGARAEAKPAITQPTGLCAWCGHDSSIILKCCGKSLCKDCRETKGNCQFCDAPPHCK